MKLYRLYMLRKSELEKIHQSLGGKYSFKERLRRKGIGSPSLYYLGGHPGIDQLNERAVDELRINLEEFKNGMMLGVSERTEPHIMPLFPEDIQSIKLVWAVKRIQRRAYFFELLLKLGVPLKYANPFSRSQEVEETRVELTLCVKNYEIQLWGMSSEYEGLIIYFKKSQFADKLKVV